MRLVTVVSRWLTPRLVMQPCGPSMTNTEKEPDDWVSGDEPRTGARASYLKTLSEECAEPDSFQPDLTKAEASKRIDALKSKRALVQRL
jgi:hypothetical protein